MGRCGTTTGGGGSKLRDSACGLESRISSPRFVDRPLVLSSLRGLKSHDSISTILESKSGDENHELTASDFAPQNSQSHNSSSTILESFGCLLTFLAFPKAAMKLNPTASDFNLESTFDKSTISLSSQAYLPFLSSRALRQQGVAIHNKKADSSPKILQSYIALESKDLSLRALAQDKARQSTSTKNAKQAMRSFFRKVDSSKDYSASAECMDCHAIATALARNDRVGRVDCHADFQSARNDRENNSASKKVDSRQTTQKSSRKRLTLESTFTPQIQLECEKLAQLLESSLYKNAFSCHIEPQAKYLLSSRALRHANPLLSSRDFRKEVVAIHNKKADSSNDYSASAEFMDCHATATQCLAMTENNTTSENEDSRENAKNVSKQPKDSRSEAQNLKTPAKDSRISTQNAPSVSDSQAAGLLIQTQNYKKWILGFAMRNLCFASRARR